MVFKIHVNLHKSLKMKKLLQTVTMSVALIFSSQVIGQAVQDSVEMGNGYANDIFYSFRNGSVHSVPRTNWDIAFHTTIWSASILTNGASGVDLYTYPNSDTAGWSSLDTNGLSGWQVMYNHDTVWEDGAFNRNAAGHPDYGWGRYNPITHDVVGDSLYVIKCLDGQYRKLWIVKKNSVGNTYYLRYANLDGTDEHNVALNNNPYISKNFVYYSFPGEELIDREPDAAEWDLLFTQYKAVHPTGSIVTVTGVLNNMQVYSNEFRPVALDYTDWQALPMDSTKSPIGWEWKTLNYQNFTYDMVDSLIFFVHTRENDIYKLYFTGFYGAMAGGKAFFTKEIISVSDVKEILPTEGMLTVIPNPVRDRFSISFEENIQGKVSYAMIDLSGRQILTGEEFLTGNRIELNLPGGTSQGMHILIVRVGDKAFTSKIIVSNN